MGCQWVARRGTYVGWCTCQKKTLPGSSYCKMHHDAIQGDVNKLIACRLPLELINSQRISKEESDKATAAYFTKQLASGAPMNNTERGYLLGSQIMREINAIKNGVDLATVPNVISNLSQVRPI